MTTHQGQPARSHGELSKMLAKVVLMERSGKRWSREEMARRTGLSAKTIQRIEDRERVPDVTQIRRIADALGKSASVLLADAEARLARGETIQADDPPVPTGKRARTPSRVRTGHNPAKSRRSVGPAS